MDTKTRRNKIIQLITKEKNVLVANLAEMFSVSEVTIRTDLRLLEKKGYLNRFHGGAIIANGSNAEVKLEDRYQLLSTIKQKIAQAAIKLINEGDTIILDSGSTTYMIAKELVNYKKNITIITNNLPAALVLANNPYVTTCVCGGTIRYESKSLHGQIAEASLKNVIADLMFVGADGIDIENGITTFNTGYAISHVMSSKSKKTVVVLDSSKFGKSCYNMVIAINDIDTIITDSQLDSKYIEQFNQKTHIDLIIT